MDSLDLTTVRRLMLALERIYSISAMESFGPEVFKAVGEVVPETLISFEQISLITGQVTSATSDDIRVTPGIRERILELVPTHPVIPRVEAGLRGAIRITDCVTQREFRMMQGRRDSEIAMILCGGGKVSLRTVNNHVRSILTKMNAETRTGACINALDRIKKLGFS